MAIIQSVTGPVDTANLGMTLMHEHVVTLSPGVYENWPHLMNRRAIIERSVQVLTDVKQRGIQTIVDLTTADLGRNIGLVREVAEAARMTIIVATGIWWQPQRFFQAREVDEVAALFIQDIEQGVAATGSR
jgi:phosphotriesterase-related protein